MPKRHKYASEPVITTKYDICQKNAPSMKIALITDLHEYDDLRGRGFSGTAHP